jgi:hypothetical protein
MDVLPFNLIPLPGGVPIDMWTLEIRFLKSSVLDDEILILPGYVEIRGTLSGSVLIKLGSSAVNFETKTFMRLDQWTHLTLASEAGSTTTSLFINGQIFADVPQRCSLPTASLVWSFYNSNVAIKDIRIWFE